MLLYTKKKNSNNIFILMTQKKKKNGDIGIKMSFIVYFTFHFIQNIFLSL